MQETKVTEVVKVDSKTYWHAHILAAQKFPGSDQEYCRQNKLTKSTFSAYKKQFGFSRPMVPRENPFVKLEPQRHVEPISETPKITTSVKETLGAPVNLAAAINIDPKWLSELILGLAGKL